MVMKIDNSSYPLALPLAGEGKPRTFIAKPGDNAPATAARGTNVSLGSTSTPLGGATNAAPVHSSKLAEIKQAISEGRIKIDTGVVADSLIKSVTDLIASQQA